MPRQRNDTGSVLVAYELGMQIGPGEEFDADLPVPGCTEVTATKTPKAKAAAEQDKETPA
jgi:hypothetical protein